MICLALLCLICAAVLFCIKKAYPADENDDSITKCWRDMGRSCFCLDEDPVIRERCVFNSSLFNFPLKATGIY